MKNRFYLSLIVVALLFLVAWTGYGQGQRSNAAKQTWEYKSVQPDSLNALGAQGWELVSVTAACPGNFAECQYWAYVKRAR